MKKVFLGLIIAVFGFSGGMTYAWDDCDLYTGSERNTCKRDTVGKTGFEKVFAAIGNFTHDVEEFNLRMEYYMRPYDEADLSFEQWKELNGYPTSGMGPLPTGEFKLPSAEKFGSLGANTDMRKFILNVLNWFLSFLGLIAVAVIIFAGYLYVVGGEEKNEQAKKMIMYASIGILVILSSYALVNTLITKTLEGGDNSAGIKSYVSIDDVVTNIEIVAECTGPSTEVADCNESFSSLGGTGYVVGEYYDISFYLDGGPINQTDGEQLEDVQWNFGDGGLYEGTYYADPTAANPVYNQGQLTRSFTEPGTYDVSVMGRIRVEDFPPEIMALIEEEGYSEAVMAQLAAAGITDIWHEFVGQTQLVVGDVGQPIITMKPTGNPDVEEVIEFDASKSIALVGAMDGFDWNCIPAAGVNEDICKDFDEKKVVEGMPTKHKKIFLASFNEPGTVTISLAIKVKTGVGTVVTTSPKEEILQILSNEEKYGTVDFTYPNTIVEGREVQLVAKGAPSDGVYEWDITDTLKEANRSTDNTQNDVLANIIRNLTAAAYQPEPPAPTDPTVPTEQPSDSIPTTPSSPSTPSSPPISLNLTPEWDFDGSNAFPGDIYPFVFPTSGVWGVRLKAYTDSTKTKQIGGDVIKNIVVASLNMPTAIAVLDDMPVIPETVNKVFRTYSSTLGDVTTSVGSELVSASCDEFNAPDEAGCTGTQNVINTWKVNGKITDEQYLERIFTELGSYDISLTTISKTDPAKKSSISFTIQVLNNISTPQLDGTNVTVDPTGTGLVTVKVLVSDLDGEIARYRLSAAEYGEIIETQLLSADMLDPNQPVIMMMNLGDALESGTYDIVFKLEVTDDDGGISSQAYQTSVPIVPTNEAPTVVLYVTPTDTGTTGALFQFFTEASDPDGDDLIYTWTILPSGETITGRDNISRKFTEAGTYPVKVTVFDGIKNVDSNTINITVTNPPE